MNTLRSWKNRATYTLSSFKQDDDDETFADVMVQNMLRHNEEFRAFVPSFIAKWNLRVDMKVEPRGSDDTLVERTGLEGIMSMPPIPEVQEENQARPILKPRGLRNRLGGLERSFTRKFSRTKTQEKRPQDFEYSCRGQKRGREVEGLEEETESLKQMRMEGDGGGAAEAPVASSCKLD